MLSEKVKYNYQTWLSQASADQDLIKELKKIIDQEDLINDAFYRDLAFGTGGLRGVIGAGTNRMNVYTVAKASQGLADYVNKEFDLADRKIAISRDSRHKSDLFAQVAASVFAANGIKVYIYRDIMPTPTLSFAVRQLKCAAGIMITASHNPSKYNGYKVYGADGCQITTEAATQILSEIEKLDVFNDIKQVDYQAAKNAGRIQYTPESVYDNFVAAVKNESLLGDVQVNKDVAIVYSPLNGTGLKPVTRVLKENGYTNISVVKEQEQPNGDFPTCPYPNPEIKQAMALGMKYAEEKQADLLLANDPDCDRVGIAVRNGEGNYVLLSGNETGMLLLDYICSRRQALGKMPVNPELVKTIVTIDMADRIAANYGVKTVNLLTGFKFIGEEIGRLEQAGHKNSYIFGFEESYGYLTGTYVRDKDGVDGSFMISEMFAYYKSQGISLLDKLQQLYTKYGYCLNTLHSYEFDGEAGFKKMQQLMDDFRQRTEGFGGKSLVKLIDYLPGVDGLPKSNVLKFILEDNCSVVVRPSGTEPKLKAYISVNSGNYVEAETINKKITKNLSDCLSLRGRYGQN